MYNNNIFTACVEYGRVIGIMYFVLLFIYIFVQTESIQPRSVNLALDTILEFNNKDADLRLIDNVQEFLDKIKNALKNKNGRRSMGRDFKFTDFLINFFEMISKYDDDDLDDVITVIDDEIRKYHYAGCRFFELLQNNDMRKFVGSKLDQIKNKTPGDMRNDVEKIIDVLNTEEEGLKEFLDYINTLYPKESKDKLNNFLNNMELYKSKSKRANLDLIKVIREGLRTAIFDHYTNLNVNARKDFKIRLETFWKNFVDPFKVEHKVWKMKYTKSDKYGRGQTTTIVTPVNHEFIDQNNLDGQTYAVVKSDTLKYFDNTYATKPTEIIRNYNELKQNSKDFTELEFPFKENFNYKKMPLNVNPDKPLKNNEMNIYSTTKDANSLINVVTDMQTEKSIDKSVFGKFKVDATAKNIVREFEESIDLHLPDIPKMVKDKFDSITKDKLLKTNKDIMRDINVDIERDDETTIKSIQKTKKYKIKKDKTNHITPKRFSVITESTTDKFYDSEEIYNINDKPITEITKKKRKHKTSTKRKLKKDTKSTIRSRLVTLYIEEYTGKVKKVKTRDKTIKPKQYTLRTEKTKKWGKSKHRKRKTKRFRDITFVDSYEYTKKTTRSNGYKDLRHAKSKHNKKTKNKINSKRSDTTKKSRKWLKLPVTDSYEGISIESFESNYRKNIDFDNFLNQTPITRTENTSTHLKSTDTERIESSTPVGSTFGQLNFWPGTTSLAKMISQKTTILPNSTKVVYKNNTTATAPKAVLRSSDVNNTFGKQKEINRHETIRLIDLKINTTDFSIKLPIITKVSKMKLIENKTSTVKSTKVSQKQKITSTKRTKTSLLKRRSIGTVKNKITTTIKKVTTANVTESTISTKHTKPTFNLGEYLNKSEVLNIEDKGKKDKIHEKIMKDMQAIFSPTTASTTQALQVFTDPFNEIENALDLE